jgi:hypothetical protein
MMKKFLLPFALLLLFSISLKAQEIEVVIHNTFKYEPVGTFEIVIDFEVINISNEEQIVFEVRTLNDLPAGWFSSLCFGELTFATSIDSIATTPPFPEPPLQPGDTLDTSVHVFVDTANLPMGTAYIQIEVGTFSNPNNRFTINFIVTTDPNIPVELSSLTASTSIS